MVHFSNQELAKTYHVSVRTVRNWIEAAKAGKLDLALHEQGKRTYVANTSKNLLVIEQLAQKGKKFRPHRAHKIVTPSPEFYNIYTQEQIYDIVSNLEIHHEIPRQYNYFDKGAASWDKYVQRMAHEETSNSLNATLKLLSTSASYIEHLIASYKYVNIIDIGVGNALPSRPLIDDILKQGKLCRYIAIDISKAMLDIAERNFHDWFGDRLKFEGYELDIGYDRFTTILAEEYIKKESQDTVNLVLLFGGTLGNMRSPEGAFRIIHDSMGVNDYLIAGQKLDTEHSRRNFDFNPNPANAPLAPNHRLIFDLFNINDPLYEVEMGYDAEVRERYIRVRLKVALSIQFVFDNGERIVDFEKDDTILLWRYVQNDALEVMSQFLDYDFYPLHMTQTDNQEYLLTISRINRD